MATVTWDGLDEEIAALDNLPDDLGAAGGLLAMSAAQQAATAIKAAYPHRSGELANGIIVRDTVLDYGARSKVVNITKYAAAFEYGRQTGKHGKTPARPTFIPIRETYQRGLVVALRALLESRGLVVSGEAGQ